MRRFLHLVAAVLMLAASVVFAATPRLKTLKVSWAPYTVPFGCSNAVIVIYKSTSLGAVWSPPKPAAYTPATRTNLTLSVLAPGRYRFFATAQGKPLPESLPSNTVEKTVE